jgi:hypothetical protein
VLKDVFAYEAEIAKPISPTEEAMSANLSIHHEERANLSWSEDPLEHSLQVLEWWSADQVRVVLQQKIVIRNGTHNTRSVPFLTSNYWDIDNAAYGLGVVRIAGSDQRCETGMLNAILDLLAFAVQPEYAVARGANIPTQDQRRRLGGIRMVDGNDATRAISLVPQPQVPPDAWRVIQSVVASSESSTGADQATVQGSIPGRGSSVVRTATGAGAVSSASSTRLQSPVERFIDGVFLPFIRYVYAQVKERMPISEIRDVLAERAEDLVVDFGDFLAQNIKFDTLAGTRLAAKNKMAQALPFLMEVFSNQAIVQQLSEIGMKVNVTELVAMILEMSEWRNQRDLVVPMSPQEKQERQQQQQAAVQANSKLTLQQQQHANDMELEDRKISGRIAENTIKQSHGAAIESPLDRASSFAERTADERSIQSTPFYAPTAVGGS